MATFEQVAPYDFQRYDSFIKLTLNPPLTDAPWGDIDDLGKNVLNELESFRTPSVLVDLSTLNYMGSAMVALIVRIWKATKAKSGQLVVLCTHPMVLKVISLAGLDKVWKIAETQEAAYRELRVKPPAENAVASAATSHSNSSLSGVVASPSRSGVTINPNRSGVNASPLYNAQGALVVGRESVRTKTKSSKHQMSGTMLVVITVLLTISALSVIVGGLGLGLMLKVASVPKHIAMTMAIGGAGVALVMALAALVMGEFKSRIVGAFCAVIACGELIVAYLNR